MKKRLFISTLFIITSVFLGSYASFFGPKTQTAEAAVAGNVKGWLWSDTIGWVSLNCLNVTGSCATAAYGVAQDTAGLWTGYGWSDNVGWIQFGGGCPPGNAGECNAKMDGTNLKGWAKFISAGNGWDGWVSLSSTNDHDFSTGGIQTAPNAYGGTLSANSVSGYAWGSTVVGWLTFQSVTIDPSSSTIYLKPAAVATPVTSVSTVTGLPTTLAMSGTGTFKLYWYADTADTIFTSCTTTSSGASTWVGSTASPIKVLPTYSSGPFTYTSSGNQTYTVTCTKSTGGTVAATATVTRGSGESCSDGIQNQDETGIDTGGVCAIAGVCSATHWNCSTAGASTSKTGGIPGPWTWMCPGSGGGASSPICSQAVSCSDGVKNQNETGIDTGGVCGGGSNKPSVVLTGGGTGYCPLGTVGYVKPVLFWTSANTTSCSASWFTGTNASNNPKNGSQPVTSSGDYQVQCTDGSTNIDSNTEKIDYLDASDPSCQLKEICFNNIDDNGNGLTDEGCKKTFNWFEN